MTHVPSELVAVFPRLGIRPLVHGPQPRHMAGRPPRRLAGVPSYLDRVGHGVHHRPIPARRLARRQEAARRSRAAVTVTIGQIAYTGPPSGPAPPPGAPPPASGAATALLSQRFAELVTEPHRA